MTLNVYICMSPSCIEHLWTMKCRKLNRYPEFAFIFIYFLTKIALFYRTNLRYFPRFVCFVLFYLFYFFCSHFLLFPFFLSLAVALFFLSYLTVRTRQPLIWFCFVFFFSFFCFFSVLSFMFAVTQFFFMQEFASDCSNYYAVPQ